VNGKSKVAVVCQAAVSWAGVAAKKKGTKNSENQKLALRARQRHGGLASTANKKNRVVEDKTAGGDGERNIKSCRCVPGSGVVGFRRGKKIKRERKIQKIKNRRCLPSSGVVGWRRRPTKKKKAVVDKRAGVDGERKIRNRRCTQGSDVVGGRRRPTKKNRGWRLLRGSWRCIRAWTVYGHADKFALTMGGKGK